MKKRVVIKGIVTSEIEGPKLPEVVNSASFRVLCYHDIMSDETILRFDIQTGKDRWTASMYGGTPSLRRGKKFEDTDPIIMPRDGVLGGMACVGDKETLASILHGLADALEGSGCG